MNFQRGKTKEDLEINLIPMIDVLLVILIFLMITTTYSKFAELQINLPTAEANKQPARPNEINIAISASGQMMINNAPVKFQGVDALSTEMRQAAGNAKDPIVVINADAKATHESVVNVMEAARLAGYFHVSFATQAANK